MTEEEMFQIKGSVEKPPSKGASRADQIALDARRIGAEVNKLEEGEWLKLEMMDRIYQEQLRVRLAYLQYKVSVRRNNFDPTIPAELYVRRKISDE